MGFWISFVVAMAISVVGELIRPKQRVPNAKASAIDDFDMPTAESGRTITIWCGRVLLNGGNVTYYGNLSTRALTKKVKTGMFSSKRQTYAYQYRLSIQHVLGFGRDDVQLHKVLFDDLEGRHTVNAQADGSTVWTFNDEGLFGGNEDGGGVQGTMRFYPGNYTQVANAHMAGLLGEPVPGYHGVCYAMFESFYVGTSKYIKSVAFEVSSYPNQLGVASGKHKIGEDANPVCFIFEVMTSKVWGVGKSASAFDLTNWREVAGVIADEGLGVSLVRNSAASGEDVVADVLRHIDGVIFSDPQTGLVRIKLARNDYVEADLPVYGERDFVSDPSFSRPSWSETRNTLLVTYTDRSNQYEPATVVFQDQANIMQRDNEVSSESVDFSGFTSNVAAVDAGMRALKTYSYPLAKLSGRLRRNAWRTRPGDVIVIDWPNLGIDKIVFRVVNVSYGDIQQNSIFIDVTEDIFAVGRKAYAPPPASEWVNPAQPPTPLARQNMIEAPYFLIASDSSYMIGFASASGSLDLGFTIQTGSSVATLADSNSSTDFTASALLAAPLARWDASGTFGGLIQDGDFNSAPTAADVAVGETLMWVKTASSEEWMSFTGIDLVSGTLTGLQRGLFDTVPQAHGAGAQVWFPPSGYAVLNDLPIGAFPSTLYARLLPYSALGSVTASAATAMNATANRRAQRPLPPGRIRIDGVRPDLIAGTVTSPFVLSWAHRSRLTEAAVSQDAPSVDPEDGSTYTIRIKNGATVLLERALIDNSATQATITSTFEGSLTVEILSSMNGLSSYQVQSYTVTHAKGTATAHTITPDEASYILDGGGA